MQGERLPVKVGLVQAKRFFGPNFAPHLTMYRQVEGGLTALDLLKLKIRQFILFAFFLIKDFLWKSEISSWTFSQKCPQHSEIQEIKIWPTREEMTIFNELLNQFKEKMFTP